MAIVRRFVGIEKETSMKAKIEGRLSAEELVRKLTRAVEQFHECYGVEQFSAVNLYFTPRDEDGEVLDLMVDGESIQGLVFREHKKPRKARTKPPSLKVVGGKDVPSSD